nr:glycoprotein vIgFam11 [Elephant endotheliotropic herpesvirus 1A]
MKLTVNGGGVFYIIFFVRYTFCQRKIETIQVGDNISIPCALNNFHREITWLYEYEQKIVEWNRTSTPRYFGKYNNTTRVNLKIVNVNDCILELFNCGLNDTGNYSIQVLFSNNNENEWRVLLYVTIPNITTLDSIYSNSISYTKISLPALTFVINLIVYFVI